MADVYFWRQAFILITSIVTGTNVGFMLTFPSLLSTTLSKVNDTDIKATPLEISWIVASNGISGLFGFFILSFTMQIFGRKVVNILTNVFLVIGWIIFTRAYDVTALLAARIIQGFIIGGVYIYIIIIGEYSNPKRRGYFVTLTKLSLSVGILLCHALSLIWNWRQLAGFAITFPVIAIILTLCWPESPSYLAMKGRSTECEKSYVWLHGGSNMQELQILMSSQLQKTNTKREKWYKMLCKNDFIKPFMIVSFLTLLVDLCGRYYLVVYVIQIMIELVGDKSIAIYCTIGVDLVAVIAYLSSCFVIRSYKRRAILFSFGAATVVLMLIICFVIILKIPGRMWLTPALILLHSFIINIGIVPVCFTIISEVIPLEHKGCVSCLTGVVFTVLYTLFLKFTPVLLESTGVEGVYAIYGISIALCLGVLYFLVPETKNRTLQEIENDFKGKKLPTSDEITRP